MKETRFYDEQEDKLIVKTEYDPTPVLEDNLKARNAAPEFGRYKGNLCHVGKIDMGDVIRLRNLGYNLLSPDKEEVKRALLYVQNNESHLLRVPGKPFSKKRVKWA